MKTKGGEYKDLHSPEVVEQYVEYKEGKLLWKLRENCTKEGRRWNSRYAGKEAFHTKNRYGYFVGNLLGKTYYSHRIVWCLYYKRWPKGFIDHINGDKSDNRLENLREVLKKDNNKNSTLRKDSKTGVTGVTIKRGAKNKPFIVNIKDSLGRQVYGGSFKTLQDASERRKELEALYGYHQNHGKVS